MTCSLWGCSVLGQTDGVDRRRPGRVRLGAGCRLPPSSTQRPRVPTAQGPCPADARAVGGDSVRPPFSPSAVQAARAGPAPHAAVTAVGGCPWHRRQAPARGWPCVSCVGRIWPGAGGRVALAASAQRGKLFRHRAEKTAGPSRARRAASRQAAGGAAAASPVSHARDRSAALLGLSAFSPRKLGQR